jgi:hypothetical protein
MFTEIIERKILNVYLFKSGIGFACSKHWEKRNTHRILVGKPEGKKPPRGPRRTWEDNIKMCLREIG